MKGRLTMLTKEPVDRKINGRYSYTKQYSSLKEGLNELFEIVPPLRQSILEGEPDFSLKYLSTRSDEEAAKVIFEAASSNIIQDFPTIYDDIYPATLALSITGDRFFYRSKNRVSLIWEYDRSFRNTGEVLINVTIQFKEPTNRLRSKIFSKYIEDLKAAGYEFNGAYEEFSRKRSNSQSNNQDSDIQQ